MSEQNIDGREHYRNTANPVRFFVVEAWAALPLPLIWLFKSWTAVIACVVSLAFFFYLEKKGMTLANFIRRMRSRISGRHKTVSHSKRRYL